MTSKTTITCDCCGGDTTGLTMSVIVSRRQDKLGQRELHICHVCFTPLVPGATSSPDVDTRALGRAVLAAARHQAGRQ